MAKSQEMVARKLPHSLEAEQAVLGCVLIDQDAPISILNEMTKDDFYTDSHRSIFECMQNLFRVGKNIDYVSLPDELEREGLLESVGGLSYISSLTNIVPSAANFRQYMDIVKRNSTLRKLISSSQKIIDKAYDADSSENVLSFAESEIYGVAEKGDRSKLEHIGGSLTAVMERFNKLVKDPDSLQGIPTGFVGLDKLTNGFQNSDLIMLAARPGVGKTSLAMNIVVHMALKENKTCAVFNLEMPKIQLAQRALCSSAKVSMQKALSAKLDDKEWRRLFDSVKKMSEANIYIDDSSINTPGGILSKCRRIQREKGLDFVMIDYLQLMSTGKRVESRQVEVSEISRNLKILAKELNVPVLVLSQLSRGIESRKGRDKKPVLSDLRESGAIEQDADIVMFIYDPDEKEEEDDGDKTKDRVVKLSIAKHRNGPIGEIPLFWRGDITTFYNLDKDARFDSLEKSMPKPKTDTAALDTAEKAYNGFVEEDAGYEKLVPPEIAENEDFVPDIFDNDEE